MRWCGAAGFCRSWIKVVKGPPNKLTKPLVDDPPDTTVNMYSALSVADSAAPPPDPPPLARCYAIVESEIIWSSFKLHWAELRFGEGPTDLQNFLYVPTVATPTKYILYI